MTVLAFPYTDRGARNERAGFERYLAEKASYQPLPGVSLGLIHAMVWMVPLGALMWAGMIYTAWRLL